MTFIIGIIKFILNVIYLLFKLFPRRKQITLISRQGNTPSQDFKLLEKQLKKDFPNYKIVMMCKKMDNKIVYCFHMLKQMYAISRSKAIILDSYCPLISLLKHKKGLKVIQIWHALGLMKKAGYSILDMEEGHNSKTSKALNMHKNYTHVFTTSEECIPSMSRVFGCKKEIISSVPLPRIDLLKDKRYIKKKKDAILKKYPILKNKINILYAPTFRKDETKLAEEIHKLQSKINTKKYNLIIKLHPLSKIKVDKEKVITPSRFTTVEMMYVSDFVISDYSSIIYEAGILSRKQVFFAFDLDSYKGKRDFFIDYEAEVPGPVCKEASEVLKAISRYDTNRYKERNLIEKYVDLTIDNYTKNMVNNIKDIIGESNEKGKKIN